MKLRTVSTIILAALLVLSIAPNAAWASQRQCVILEGFTQWNCGPCATWNPQEHDLLEQMTRDTVIACKYHGWWPGSDNDPFYHWNETDNAARISMYGVEWVPWVMVDGIVDLRNVSYNAVRNALRSRYTTQSPCTIDLSAFTAGETTVGFNGTITMDADQSLSGQRLFVALIQDHVYYENGGTNGEHDFYEPFRDMYPNANTGVTLNLGPSETYDFEGTLNRDSRWEAGNMKVIAWIQNTGTHEILQGTWSEVHEDYRLDVTFDDTIQRIVDPDGGEVNYLVDMSNMGLQDDIYTVTLSGDWPGGWSYSVESLEVPADPDEISIPIESGGNDVLIVRVNPNGSAGSVAINLDIISTSAPEIVHTDADWRLMAGLDILIVDDDEGYTYETCYENALAPLGVDYVIGRWDVDLGALDGSMLDDVDLLVWFTGDSWQNGNTLSAQDQDMLFFYLAQGGALFLSGQGITFDIRLDPFFSEQLHASFVTVNLPHINMEGVAGDPVSNGMSFAIRNGDCADNQVRQSGINVGDEAASILFEYAGTEYHGALRIEDPTYNYRAIFMAFGFEAIDSQENRNALMESAVNWLLRSTPADEVTEPVAPLSFKLGQNFPNPFNPQTTIPYTLPERAEVSLRVFDMLGREVVELVSGQQEAGAYSATWDAGSLTSGMYFYRLEAATGGTVYRETRKLLLLK